MQSAVQYNPMTPLIASYQRVLVEGLWPNWLSLWPVTTLAVLLCAFGLRLFRQHSGEMVDEL